MQTYFFQPDKKMLKQGFYLTDENKKVVYEAICLKNPLLGAAEFEFVNHIKNARRTYKVGKTMTMSYNDNQSVFDTLSIKSWFKLDDKNVWNYLHDEGVRINTAISGQRFGMKYEVSFRGQPMATIETASPSGKGMLTTGFFYNITTEEENLDLAFLLAFTFVKTSEQAFKS